MSLKESFIGVNKFKIYFKIENFFSFCKTNNNKLKLLLFMSDIFRAIHAHPRRAFLYGAGVGLSALALQILWKYIFNF